MSKQYFDIDVKPLKEGDAVELVKVQEGAHWLLNGFLKTDGTIIRLMLPTARNQQARVKFNTENAFNTKNVNYSTTEWWVACHCLKKKANKSHSAAK